MKILGIETSCDETAAAVVEDGVKILSSVVSSSLPLHAKAGGIIPEVAAREQVRAIIPVIDAALQESEAKARGLKRRKAPIADYRLQTPAIDAVAVTVGPGLIGSLLVGVEAAKALAHVWKKPIVPVNHLLAHLYSPWLENPQPPEFPLVALIVSGGHTELFFVVDHGKWRHLGGTRDDAAGEALDKTARLLGLGYPGGPAIEKKAMLGDKTKFPLPRPLIDSPTLDFSFSGLKTAVVNLVDQLGDGPQLTTGLVADLAAGIQETIVEVLVTKTVRAAKKFSVGNIVLGGGVASNKQLRDEMASKFTGKVYFAPPGLTTDNAAMVAAAAYFNYQPSSWDKVHTDPTLLI